MGQVSRILGLVALGLTSFVVAARANDPKQGLEISASEKDGSYTIASASQAVIHANAAVKVDGKWFHAADYPEHHVTTNTVEGALGRAKEWSIVSTGEKTAPTLLVKVRAYAGKPFGELHVTATNSTGKPLDVQSIRLLDASGEQLLDLGGPPAADRVLSDSFSEDRPAMQLRDLTNAENQVHRGVGSQLVYNRQSRQSWFIGALTSDKFLTVLRLHMAPGANSTHITSYEIDSTGTTELLKENSLQDSSAQDQVELSLPLAPGEQLASERMLFSVSRDYHEQLETYAHLIRDLHHARVSAPTPIGWWSWTAYYFGLNEGTALTNAQWLSQHLKAYGYQFFHMDEGYQFARGEYATPDATLFPHGVAALERKVMNEGLTPGIWTAPFEVSERSYVYTRHPEWLVKNAQGQPIHLGLVTDNVDHLYALDTTNPEAQAYLRTTYSTMVNTWGIRYFKMDFMEDSAVEGFYFKPHTTALEAQRIGIQVIRDAVGEHVLLDKDGCELLNPVGLVDMGRISQDTGHTFSSSKDAAPGIAARYYMNRNYFLADPDAFSVSTQTVDDQNWHGGAKALSLDEAKVSIALTAVSGGLFEIGDDLPTLGEDAGRVALVRNPDLLNMARLGRSSTPVDLMSYSKDDEQPSIFMLKESPRQSILTVFNWTDQARSHKLMLADLGLQAHQAYSVVSTLDDDAKQSTITDEFTLSQPAHSVRVVKLIDSSVTAEPPVAKATIPAHGHAGETLAFIAEPAAGDSAIVGYVWDFGDGITVGGRTTEHAFTHEGTFQVKLRATSVDGSTAEFPASVKITGTVSTKYHPEAKRRFE